MLENGQTWCWGSNANGQLGQPKDMPTEGTFQISVPDGGIQQLVATNSMSCVRRGTGDVWCWGDARCGFEHPESLRGTYDDIVFELNDALCLRNRTGTLECAFDGPRGVGKPIPGKSCDGRWREIKLPTVNVPSLVAGTSAFVCTSEGDALVMCRRESPFPTGNDLEESYTFPQPVEQLVMLEEALCARLQNGDVWCMGKNGTGTLGVGDAVSSRPLEVQR